jgi:hypothetical protein
VSGPDERSRADLIAAQAERDALIAALLARIADLKHRAHIRQLAPEVPAADGSSVTAGQGRLIRPG